MIYPIRKKSMLKAKKFFRVLILAAAFSSGAMAAGITPKSQPIDGANTAVAYLKPNDATVYGYNTDTYFHPASTQKVLTAAAAILYLGHDYTLKTELLVSPQALNEGKLQVSADGTLPGDVVIRFTGDPSFTSKKYNELIHNLAKAGVKKIAGSVILDISRFSGRSRGQGWSWDDLPVCFTAPAASVIINRNCAYTQLKTEGLGKIATPIVLSGNPVGVTSDAITVRPREYGGDCQLEADLYMDNKYHIRGCLPQQEKGKPFGLSLSVTDPDTWGVDWTAIVFKQQHITYAGIKLARKAIEGYAEYKAVTSQSMGEMVRYMLHRSNNLYADAVAKNLAVEYYHRPATYNRAVTAIRQVLSKYAGIKLGNAYLVDGSGLSPHNLITPHQMLDLLEYLNKNDDKLQFLKLMPVGGVSGTAKYRASLTSEPLKGKAIVKTGALTNVSNLVGLLTTKSGVRVPFVVFGNMLTYPQKTRDALAFHRISQPHLAYEKYVLQQIYNEETVTRP